VVTALVALGAASCTVEQRNFGSTGGAGGTGGDGGSGGSAMACMPDAEGSCYPGPMETSDVGLCKPGIHVCLPSGEGFGECGGEVVPAPENCLTPEDEACNGNDSAECPSLGDGWLKVFGSVGFPQTVQDLAITNTGDIVVVGSFADTIDFGNGPIASTGSSDIFVAKFDPLGNAIWSKRFGDASTQVAHAVAVDNTGAISVGGAMAGPVAFEGTLLTSAGASDAFLARFEADGKFVWARNFGDTLAQTIRHLAVTKTNLVIAAGEFAGVIDFGGSPNVQMSAGSTDIFLARFDTSGFISGSRRFGGPTIDTVRGMALDSADQIYLTGGYEGTATFNGPTLISTGARDANIVQLTPTLNTPNAQGFGYANGPTTYQEGYDVAVAPNDDVFLAGGFVEGLELPGQFLPNADPLARSMFLVHFTPQLASVLTSQSYGGIGGVVPDTRLAIDGTAQHIAIAGSFTGDINFGGGMMHAEGASDPFLAKLSFVGIQIAARTLPNEPSPSDNPNTISALALLPSGDLIIGGVERSPIIYGKAIVGADEPKDGNAMLGRFLH